MKILESTDGTYVEITLFIHHETEKAMLLSDNGVDTVWVAKSKMEDIGIPELTGERAEVTIVIPEWVAINSGWC